MDTPHTSRTNLVTNEYIRNAGVIRDEDDVASYIELERASVSSESGINTWPIDIYMCISLLLRGGVNQQRLHDFTI